MSRTARSSDCEPGEKSRALILLQATETPRTIHPKPICITIICKASLPVGCALHWKPFARGVPVNIQRKSVAAPVDFTMGERLEIDRLRFALERDFRYGFPAG